MWVCAYGCRCLQKPQLELQEIKTWRINSYSLSHLASPSYLFIDNDIEKNVPWTYPSAVLLLTLPGHTPTYHPPTFRSSFIFIFKNLLSPITVACCNVDSIMCRSCPGNHSCSGFIRATMCSPKESISEHYSASSVSSIPSPPLSSCPKPCVGRLICVPLRAEHSTAHNLSSLTIYESLHCCPLKKKASLASAENSANLWV